MSILYTHMRYGFGVRCRDVAAKDLHVHHHSAFLFSFGLPSLLWNITKTRLFKYIENFTSKSFSDKNSDIFPITVQNIDCGYSLEPPRRGGSKEYPQSMF